MCTNGHNTHTCTWNDLALLLPLFLYINIISYHMIFNINGAKKYISFAIVSKLNLRWHNCDTMNPPPPTTTEWVPHEESSKRKTRNKNFLDILAPFDWAPNKTDFSHTNIFWSFLLIKIINSWCSSPKLGSCAVCVIVVVLDDADTAVVLVLLLSL